MTLTMNGMSKLLDLLINTMKKLILIFWLFSCAEENLAQMMNNNVLLASKPHILETQNSVWMATAQTATMIRGGGVTAGNIPNEAITTDGDTVGTMYDQGVNALIIRNSSGIEDLPTLDSDGDRNSFLTFDGTDDVLVVQSTLGFFKPIHGSNPVYTLMFWVKFNAKDAGTHCVMNTGIGSGGVGLQVTRNTSNKLLFQAINGSGTYYTYTSTSNFTVADGWRGVILTCSGAGVGLGRVIIFNSALTEIEDATFNTNGTSSAANESSGLWIGWRPALTATQQFAGSIGDLILKPIAVTDQIIEAFRTYNPPRTSAEFSPRLQLIYDFNDINYMYTDAAGTTPTSDEARVRLVKNKKATNFGTMSNGLINSVSDATSPTFESSVINGLGGLDFDGTDDNLDFQQLFFNEVGGKWTVFTIVQNRDDTNGSHFYSGSGTTSGDYGTITGANYSVPGIGLPRMVHHALPAGGNSLGIEGAYQGVNNVELVAVRRNLTAFKAWNMDKVTATNTIEQIMTMTRMGQDAFSGDNLWWMDGFVIYIEKYNGVLSDLQIEARIDELNEKYNLLGQ